MKRYFDQQYHMIDSTRTADLESRYHQVVKHFARSLLLGFCAPDDASGTYVRCDKGDMHIWKCT